MATKQSKRFRLMLILLSSELLFTSGSLWAQTPEDCSLLPPQLSDFVRQTDSLEEILVQKPDRNVDLDNTIDSAGISSEGISSEGIGSEGIGSAASGSATSKTLEKDVEKTDELLDRDNEKTRDEEKRGEVRQNQLRALRKPITEIVLASNPEDAQSPENQARNLQTDDALFVSSSGNLIIGPDRYTSGFSHQPLYFEQSNLERCGNHWGYFQNGVSAIEFLANVKTLPYHLGRQSPHSCVPSLGDCKTCEAFPEHINPFPLESKAAIFEAAAIAGFVLLVQ